MCEPDPGLEELLEERIVIMQELQRALLPQARVLECPGVCAPLCEVGTHFAGGRLQHVSMSWSHQALRRLSVDESISIPGDDPVPYATNSNAHAVQTGGHL